VGTNAFTTRVKDLFSGKAELLLGINACLPNGLKITLKDIPIKDPSKITFSDANRFVGKVKARFQDEDRTCTSFLKTLELYRENNKTCLEVYNEVTTLFQNHVDLLEEFCLFLPIS
ncbi:paired amphipathic helix protein Sin3-like 5, partial [Capsella rubella]|uniref:paired amphipathic helix protein Sin3-like 5 n=1 Tax=Capsella rubella TaxID=81985 RepID=UPI000CD4FBEB